MTVLTADQLTNPFQDSRHFVQVHLFCQAAASTYGGLHLISQDSPLCTLEQFEKSNSQLSKSLAQKIRQSQIRLVFYTKTQGFLLYLSFHEISNRFEAFCQGTRGRHPCTLAQPQSWGAEKHVRVELQLFTASQFVQTSLASQTSLAISCQYYSIIWYHLFTSRITLHISYILFNLTFRLIVLVFCMGETFFVCCAEVFGEALIAVE